MKPVGILGGMGPEATIFLMGNCVDAVDARDDADHIPLIVHQNPQVPSRIAALIDGTGTDPTPVLQAMARDLAAAGAQALAMPCNTAHHYADAIRVATDLPFLDMIDHTAAHLAGRGGRRIGILASPATRIVGVFDRYFPDHGLEAVFLPDDAPALGLIRSVKAGNKGDAEQAQLAMFAEHLLGLGCDHILVACTEFSMLTDGLPASLPWVDSLQCLTTAIVDFARA